MKVSKFKVLLYLKKSNLDKQGKAPIMGRITLNSSRAHGVPDGHYDHVVHGNGTDSILKNSAPRSAILRICIIIILSFRISHRARRELLRYGSDVYGRSVGGADG